MSILDKLNIFRDNTALTVTGISDVIDLGDQAVTRNIGGNEPAYWVVQVGTALTDAGSDATLVVELLSDSTANLATSPTVHASTGTLAFAAAAPANTVLAVVPLPYGAYERFLGDRATVGAGPFTGGTLRSFITRDPQYWRAFTSNNPAFR